jgi:hypothetical protein
MYVRCMMTGGGHDDPRPVLDSSRRGGRSMGVHSSLMVSELRWVFEQENTLYIKPNGESSTVAN